MKKNLLLFFLFILSKKIDAQQLNLPMNEVNQLRYSQQLYDTSNDSHTSMQPFIESMVKYDKTYIPPFLTTSYSLTERKLTRESLIIIKNDSLEVTLDPLFYFTRYSDKESKKKYFRNTRGFWIRGNIGSRFSFETSFIENQITTPTYLQKFVSDYKVFPGMGRTKPFKKNGFDYAMSSGYISYSPSKIFNLQFGHGKLFVGNGYRSLLLSDNAFNFPHFKTTLRKGKVQYNWIVASLMNLNNPDTLSVFSEPFFRKKKASFHLLSYKPSKRIEIAFFQGVIYNMDASKFNWNVLNPIIFSQAAGYGLATKNNVIVGFNANVKILSNLLFYSQLMCDDYGKNKNSIANKTGLQLGARMSNIGRIPNFNVRFEYNSVRPFAYQQKLEKQAFSHYNQPLAHPLNANFKEYVFITDYSYNNIILKLKIISANIGTDSLKFNAGNIVLNSTSKNIFNSNFSDVKMLRGDVTNILIQDISIGYVINPINSFSVSFGHYHRYSRTDSFKYLYLGVSAFIFNQYLDF